MPFRNTLMATALALGLAAAPAQAAIISGTWTFSASGFSNGFAPFSGSFSFSFDNSADIIDSTALTVNSLTPNPFGAIGFTYFTNGDILGIGGMLNGAGNVSSNTVDFLLVFTDASTAAPVAASIAVANGGDLSISTTTLTGSFTPDRVPVPEPASLAILGLGLLGLGLARRRAPARDA